LSGCRPKIDGIDENPADELGVVHLSWLQGGSRLPQRVGSDPGSD
jgi:hypothetical protein